MNDDTETKQDSGPLFTKRHYEKIAEALNKEMLNGNPLDDAWSDGFTAAAMAMAAMFEEDNVRFSFKFFFDRVNYVPGQEDA